MSQSLRATLGAILIVGGLVALIAWLVRPLPHEMRTTLIVRYVSLGLCAASAGLLIWGKKLKDKAPDFLGSIGRKYFERDGFCFLIISEMQKEVCCMTLYYQNRYEKPCTAVVYLRPTKVAFSTVSDLPQFMLRVACQGGEFGKAFKPWSPPLRFQGKSVLWDVSADVDYPQGRGQLLRMRDGIRTGPETANLRRHVFAFLGAMTGHISYHRPARTSLTLPAHFEEGIPPTVDWQRETIWKIGDPAR